MMLSKQLTSKLKEEQDKENQQNPSHLNVAQCDRLIRTVSCKHDTNHAIRKTNINVLQTFDEIKLYSVPIKNQGNESSTLASDLSHDETRQQQNPGSFSSKLPRRNNSTKVSSPGHHNSSSSSSDIVEINLKDILSQIINNLSNSSCVNEWFKLSNVQQQQHQVEMTNGSNLFCNEIDEVTRQEKSERSLFESIENALNHIDFNLKRNSDFINELTKLLDTSRAIQQEKQLKKLLKSIEDEKLNSSNLSVPANQSQSQPSSPNLRSSSQGGATAPGTARTERKQFVAKEDQLKKPKSRSFKGFPSFKSRSSSKENRDAAGTTTSPTSNQSNPENQQQKSNNLGLPPTPTNPQQSTQKNSLNSINVESSFQKQLKLNQQQQNHEVSNSDYMELEIEVEKISYHLESLSRAWSKLSKARLNLSSASFLSSSPSSSNDQIKYSLEFQNIISNLNSSTLVKDLEQSLFKLNWLITSKSGFSEPNWQSTVLSLTPSTIDSFIGVNLLKNYYRYVKYDFVSYKLFTRQLQLIQICAIILHLVNSILVFYKEMVGDGSKIASAGSANNGLGGLTGDPNFNSFNFASDKFRPISWSANHVTLYNMQTNPETTTSPGLNRTINREPYRTTNLSRSSSTRRPENPQLATSSGGFGFKEEQLRQVKSELFLNNLEEFLKQSTQRLNIQASLANRTGYFYIVNQSTGLVLQAVDFTSEFSLKEQIENNQKRIQSSSIKATSGGGGVISGGGGARSPSNITKGPRFYLMPKVSGSPKSSNLPANNTVSSSLSVETAHDEQLWYYYLINGCLANKIIRSGYCMAASSLNAKSPVTFWPNVKTTNCSWYFNHQDQTIVSGLSDDLVLDYVIIDEQPNQRYAVVIDAKVQNKASQKWAFEFN